MCNETQKSRPHISTISFMFSRSLEESQAH